MPGSTSTQPSISSTECLKDVVQQITGVSVRETVPDRIIDEAYEIELVDLAHGRTGSIGCEKGSVYPRSGDAGNCVCVCVCVCMCVCVRATCGLARAFTAPRR